jgi:hypothetical protein
MKPIIMSVFAGLLLAAITWLFKVTISKVKKHNDHLFSRSELNFSKYFVTHGSEVVDYVVYQLGLRPSIPIVDLLYLEFLHHLLINRSVTNKVIIYPVPDLSAPLGETGEVEYIEFKKNVLSVFKSYEDQVTVLSHLPILPDVKELLSSSFLNTVRYIGSEQYIKKVKRITKTEIKNYAHFNKHHPKELRLVNLFVHTMRGWISLRKLESVIDLHDGLRIGYLIWETELDKLGQFMCFLENKRMNVNCSIFMGKTLCAKGRPLPVFDCNKTLDIFCSESVIVNLVSHVSNKAARKYIEILQVILKQNYSESVSMKESEKLATKWLESRLISHPEEDVNFTKMQHILLGKIQMLKAKYLLSERNSSLNDTHRDGSA